MLRRILGRGIDDSWASAGLLVLRVAIGIAFMTHGWHKIQNPFGWMGSTSGTPGFLQALAALSEFGGGLGWILGLLTPLCCAGILCTMTFAILHLIRAGDPFQKWELAAAYFAVAFLLLMAGPGRFSLDGLLFRRGKT